MQNESEILNADTRIAELKAAKDVEGERLWTTDRLVNLIQRRTTLQREREEEENACFAAESKKMTVQAKYRMVIFSLILFF